MDSFILYVGWSLLGTALALLAYLLVASLPQWKGFRILLIALTLTTIGWFLCHLATGDSLDRGLGLAFGLITAVLALVLPTREPKGTNVRKT